MVDNINTPGVKGKQKNNERWRELWEGRRQGEGGKVEAMRMEGQEEGDAGRETWKARGWEWALYKTTWFQSIYFVV